MRRAATAAFAVGSLVGVSVLVPFAAPAAAEGEAERPTFLGREFYTGEFHAHTSVSDGVELPDDAFEHVAGETDADFFAVTEHDVMWDLRNGDDFVDDWRDAESEEWRWLHEQSEAYNAGQDELVVVPAIENTWYDGTGHINVFNTDWHATARATEQGSNDGFGNSFGTGDMKYDMYTFFARLKLDEDAIGQFNHPRATGKGNFFGFNGLDPVVDDRMELIEVKDDAQYAEFLAALDSGWHLGPVWNGDEHAANWVTSNPSITGIWATEQSLDGLYGAMQERSVFTTQDVNSVLAFGAGDALMGAILPGDTASLSFDVNLSDPDDGDSFTSVQLLTNDGEVAHTFDGVGGSELVLAVDLPVADGDYYFVRADQADGDFVVSAPIWIGETTRGADYAPVITVADDVPAQAAYGETIDLPEASAVDDSGETPDVAYEVYDAAGEVPVTDGTFQVRSYDDHFVVVKATDSGGNTNAELFRITVDQTVLDPDGVFQYFGSTAAVAEQPGGAGIAVSTDRSIAQVYAQVMPAGGSDWSTADVLTSTNDRPYEVNTIGNDEPEYQHSITGQTLRSHEFDVTGLEGGERYQYRFGVATDGQAPEAADAAAWTDVQGEFVAGGTGNEPVYVLGDLQATSHDPDELGLMRDMLGRLQTEVPGGGTVLQTGDLVDNGGRGQYWDEVFDHVYDGLDVQVAPVAGNHETYGDLDYNTLSTERTAIFSNMYDLPEGGAVGESSYSFDRGDIHIAVLNSTVGIDAQLEWLTQDIRASTRQWNVVVGHYSYYGGRHGDDADLAADRPKITAALDRLGVDLYIGAHDHLYKRSTIYDGRLATTPEEEALGTTFVTMGSAGPKFYENVAHWWDDVVFDEDTQVGSVLEVTDDGLVMSTYTLDGRPVDTVTVRKPAGHWQVTSTDIADREMDGVGLLSYPGSRDTLTVAAATYDRAQETMVDLRVEDVRLDHRGIEQFVEFDSPLPVDTSETVRVFVWDSLTSGVPLQPAMTVREGLDGGGTPDDPYLIQSAADLPKIAQEPAGSFLLTTDLDLTDVPMAQLGRLVPFTGVLDGGGHTITGYTAPPDQGVGLFAVNQGTIRNLVLHGEVTSEATNAGLLADVNRGTIESVRTSGSITATTRVGGIVGDHHGVVRDSYSTADVHATTLYSGGVVGIAQSGSVTENVLATGAVTADTRNAGGVVSYGYDETWVQHAVSLNSLVSAPSYAHAVVGRVANGQVALLADNHTSAAVPVNGESLPDAPAADNWKGAIVPVAEIRTQAFFEGLGWDFASVWDWDADGLRPILRGAPEDVPPPPEEPTAPELEQDVDGFYLLDDAADLAEVAAWPAERFRLTTDLDLTGVAVPRLGAEAPFTGELDGAGHVLTSFTSTEGGLFAAIGPEGSVHDLGVVGTVSRAVNIVGILVDTHRGTLERVFTAGTVSGPSYAAGVAGTSFGTIRDAYSTADVATTATNYAGGIIGVADSPSLTERVYATGAVEAAGTTAGGITGYARNSETVVRSSVALNPTVTATSIAHRVVARFASGQAGTLADNHAIETLVASVQTSTDVGPTTFNGATLTVADARSQAWWQDALGWDLDAVWQWDADGARPVLRTAVEDAPPVGEAPAEAPSEQAPSEEPSAQPAEEPSEPPSEPAPSEEPTEPEAEPTPEGAEQPAEGAESVDGAAAQPDAGAAIVQVDHPGPRGVTHEAVLGQDGVTTVTVHAGAEAAGAQVSLLVLEDRSDARRPTVDDVLYLGEATADDAGSVSQRMSLPEPERRDEPWLAVGTSAGTRHYGAPLDARDAVAITVDGVAGEIAEGRHTAGDVLEAAGYDPAEHDLAEPRGHGGRLHVFRDGQRVWVQEGDVYVTVATPTTET
ncbi:metallophosphoesterase [Beutenbergia cavernae DSM 12333]|uniref:Metallophosphoesterase n=1 Tax=Beutenbergia cavernae (strain ATCC BAA-8 / DSM 12333 / CCUG 43141 / JCM 11478 / NBRC 16432 / NCIMB 13614 / HKI 0122) TaxID=471853 RepID=C5C211_BEUC1|nr:metallophosphoesterase [Beutenbergia cavernae]ACQ81636.1 metallophosphoesterase [Beutenbergia cavernae DSM 12333]